MLTKDLKMIMYLRPKPLIVTQQLIIGADLYLQMSKLGYDVIGINNYSRQALETIGLQRPSVVLIDLSLKGTIDALDLCGIIQTDYQLPVILLNPGMDQETFNQAVDIKPSSIMHIPYKRDDLKNKIEFASMRFQSVLKENRKALLTY